MWDWLSPRKFFGHETAPNRLQVSLMSAYRLFHKMFVDFPAACDIFIDKETVRTSCEL
jgi:hypothetical protein